MCDHVTGDVVIQCSEITVILSQVEFNISMFPD